MNRYIMGSLMLTCLLFSSLSLVISAQTQGQTVEKMFPVLVDIKQIVPVETMVELPDGITHTLPLTMIVNLQIELEGPNLVTTTVITPTDPISVTVRDLNDDAEDVAAPPVQEINGVEWSITEVERLGQNMKLRNQAGLDFDTRGEFLMFHFELENVTNEPIEMGGNNDFADVSIQLIDAKNRKYAPFEVGYVLAELCPQIQLNPSIPVSCIMPFEIPTGTDWLYIQISSIDEDEKIQIDIIEE